MKNFSKPQFFLVILFGVCVSIWSVKWFIGKQDTKHPVAPLETRNEVNHVEIIDSSGTLRHRIQIEVNDYSEPVTIDYPSRTPSAEYLSDEVISAYLSACNLISTDYDTFVSSTTQAFRRFSRLESRVDFEREVKATKRLAAERGVEISTNSVFLYKVFVTADFGTICYLVGLPPLVDGAPSSVAENDYTYTPMVYEDGQWRFESPQRFRDLGLMYLDYKDRDFLRKLATSERAFLDSTGEKIERME